MEDVVDLTTIADCIMLLSRVEKIEKTDQSYVLKAALESDDWGLLVKDQHRKNVKNQTRNSSYNPVCRSGLLVFFPVAQ